LASPAAVGVVVPVPVGVEGDPPDVGGPGWVHEVHGQAVGQVGLVRDVHYAVQTSRLSGEPESIGPEARRVVGLPL